LKFLYDVSHHACCMTFSALVDLSISIHFSCLIKCIFVTRFMCIFFNSSCIACPPPLFSVHVSDCCSIRDLIFWVCFLHFGCLLCVFMCRVCMVFTPTTSTAYYCFMICFVLVCYKISFLFFFNTSIPQYEILVLLCQRLPTGVRVYSYLQSHASSCLPERELLLAQWGARGCLQRTRTRIWQSGVPEVAQNLKSQT